MALLEVVLLAVAQAAAGPPPKADPPPLELLEFLADWTNDDGKLIDKEKAPDKRDTGRKRNRTEERDAKGTTP
jgi:hypothetical protein